MVESQGTCGDLEDKLMLRTIGILGQGADRDEHSCADVVVVGRCAELSLSREAHIDNRRSTAARDDAIHTSAAYVYASTASRAAWDHITRSSSGHRQMLSGC